MHQSSPPPRFKLSLGIFLEPESLAQAILQCLDRDRYSITLLKSSDDIFTVIEQEKQHLDCLILKDGSTLAQLTKRLHGQAILIPAVIISAVAPGSNQPVASNLAIASNNEVPNEVLLTDRPNLDLPHTDSPSVVVVPPSLDVTFVYHTAEVWITTAPYDSISDHIEQAISQFLHLSPTCRLSTAQSTVDLSNNLAAQNFLLLQQRRLTEKLKERLGYLGVYYKRNPRNFFRYMALEQQQEILEQLREHYREIILHYFSEDDTLNQRIDEFVNTAFFADIATSQVVEIHMDLMDEFAKQLRLEGRSDDVLLDYRLTLIDTIAHLCEMYRRSVPRETQK